MSTRQSSDRLADLRQTRPAPVARRSGLRALRHAALAGLTAALAAVVAAASGAAVVPAAQADTPPATPPLEVSGVDVSGWQHPGYAHRNRPGWVPDHSDLDWSQVAAAGHQFAIIKASEGTDFVNPYYAGDVERARAAGLVVGAYHYARPAAPVKKSARAEARHFADVIGTLPTTRTLPPVLDLEVNGGLTEKQVATWAHAFLEELRARTGRTPMLYSYDSFLRTDVARLESFAGYPLWLARYRSTPPPDVPGAWERWTIWQHTSTGTVPGISGNVDLNWFNGTREDLLALASAIVPARLTKSTLQKGERTYVTGALGPEQAGAVVRLRKKVDGVWKDQRQKTVRADGTYTFTLRPLARTVHRYRVHLSSPTLSTRSKTLKVTVAKPWVGATPSAKKVKAGTPVVVTGRTDAFYQGRRILLHRQTSAGLKKLRKKKVRADGTVRFKVKAARGRNVFRVELRANKPFRAHKKSGKVVVRGT